jgi:hypothetical protein
MFFIIIFSFGLFILSIIIGWIIVIFTIFTPESGDYLCSYPQLPVSRKGIEINYTYERTHRELYEQKIPLHIIQTNFRKRVPSKLYYTVEHLISINQEYEYRYFDDQKCHEFLQENFDKEVLECYDILIPGAFKADLFRAAYLYKNGGVYIDTGMYSYIPLRDILMKDDTFVSVKDFSFLTTNSYVYNGFIATIPEHPIVKNYLERIIRNVKNRDYCDHHLSITGPKALGISFEEAVGESVKGCKDYGNGIRLFELKIPRDFIFTRICMICWDNISYIYTKYNGYYVDQNKSNKPHYTDYYYHRQVFGETGFLPTTFLPTYKLESYEDEQVNYESIFKNILVQDFSLSGKRIESITDSSKINIITSIPQNNREKLYLKYLKRINADCNFIHSGQSDKFIKLDKIFLYPLSLKDNRRLCYSNAFEKMIAN